MEDPMSVRARRTRDVEEQVAITTPVDAGEQRLLRGLVVPRILMLLGVPQMVAGDDDERIRIDPGGRESVGNDPRREHPRTVDDQAQSRSASLRDTEVECRRR